MTQVWFVCAPVAEKKRGPWTKQIVASSKEEAMQFAREDMKENNYTLLPDSQDEWGQKFDAWLAGKIKDYAIKESLEHLEEEAKTQLPCGAGTGYCNSDHSKGKTYSNWEDEIATPFLKSQGYEVDYWWTLEGDSFGPLIRATYAKKDGLFYKISYG